MDAGWCFENQYRSGQSVVERSLKDVRHGEVVLKRRGEFTIDCSWS